MGLATGMFNTVYEAEGAVRRLRGAGFQDLEIVARDSRKRAVLVDDLITRKTLLYDTSVETIQVGTQGSPRFLQAIHAGLPADSLPWFRQWLDDGYVLVAAYVEESDQQAAMQIITANGGVPPGTSRDIMSALHEHEPPPEENLSDQLPIEGEWRRRAG